MVFFGFFLWCFVVVFVFVCFLWFGCVLFVLLVFLFFFLCLFCCLFFGVSVRAPRSIIDHMHIIEALEARDTRRAEELVRDHALGLAEHVKRYADYLD